MPSPYLVCLPRYRSEERKKKRFIHLGILFIRIQSQSRNNKIHRDARAHTLMWSLCAKDRNHRYTSYTNDLSIQLAMCCHIVTISRRLPMASPPAPDATMAGGCSSLQYDRPYIVVAYTHTHIHARTFMHTKYLYV